MGGGAYLGTWLNIVMLFIIMFSQGLRHNNDNDNTNVKRTDT